MRDKLFNCQNDISDFRFDESVVAVFDDMVKRSVPGYKAMIQMVGLIARTYGKDHTNYYDLGCSTGTITLSLALNNKHKNNKSSSMAVVAAMFDFLLFSMSRYSFTFKQGPCCRRSKN